MARIAIVGGGSMGEALLSGFLRANHPVKNLVVAEQDPGRQRHLRDTYSVLVTSVADAAENATVVVIAVKPADVATVIDQIAEVIAAAPDTSPEQVLVSVAAGVTTGYLESRLPAGTPVIRLMPNTPVRVRAGASVLAAGRFVRDEQIAEVVELFGCVGTVITVGEAQLDAATAVSGSGPAYFFLLVEALVDAGVGVGLSRSVATRLAVQTMAGSAAMLQHELADRGDGDDRPLDADAETAPARLRAAVTSPAGTTAAALRELERCGLRAAVDHAVQAAKTRAEQLKITSE